MPKLPTTLHTPKAIRGQLVAKPVLHANNETTLQGSQHANPRHFVPSVKQRRNSATPMKIRLKARRHCRGRPHSYQTTRQHRPPVHQWQSTAVICRLRLQENPNSLHLYQTEMGPLQLTKTRFRAYGTHTFIQVHGEIAATLLSENGARHTTTVYVVEGYQAEPLLGNSDAKALGIPAINKGGRHALPPNKDNRNYRQHPSSRDPTPHHKRKKLAQCLQKSNGASTIS